MDDIFQEDGKVLPKKEIRDLCLNLLKYNSLCVFRDYSIFGADFLNLKQLFSVGLSHSSHNLVHEIVFHTGMTSLSGLNRAAAIFPSKYSLEWRYRSKEKLLQFVCSGIN